MQKGLCSAEEKLLLMTVNYLDNSATTRVSEKAAQKALLMMTEKFGNPSSVYSLGLDAERELNSARETIAKRLGADKTEIFFTSCGTEANNLAIFGAADARKRLGNKIITSAVEHPSVLNAVKELERRGFKAVYLPVGNDGKIRLSDLERELDDSVILVSVMAVNNETGAIQPIKEACALTKRAAKNALFHCDMVQGFGKLCERAKNLGADLVSISGHKVHAPKGIGALYVKKGVRINSVLFGGGQEKNLRSGTENLPAAAAFGVAVSEIPDEAQALEKTAALRDRLKSGLEKIDGIVFNSPNDALPYILNFSLCGVPSEVMIHYLEGMNIFVSGGSACSKGGRSHVLEAQGLPVEIIDSAVRVSFSTDTTTEQVDELCLAVTSASKILRRKKR